MWWFFKRLSWFLDCKVFWMTVVQKRFFDLFCGVFLVCCLVVCWLFFVFCFVVWRCLCCVNGVEGGENDRG